MSGTIILFKREFNKDSFISSCSKDFNEQELVDLCPSDTGIVLIGISEFHDPEWTLRGPVNDVLLMRSVFQNYYQVPHVNFYTLYNRNATKSNILNTIHTVVKRYSYVIVYLSTHGSQVYSDSEPDYKAEVIVTYDHDWNDPLLDKELFVLLSQAKYSLLIADCCHAQGMSRGNVVVKSIVAPMKVKNLKKISTDGIDNVGEIASCLSHEVSLEMPFDGKWYGNFTYHFCNNILKKNKHVKFDELQALLRKEISMQQPIITAPRQVKMFSLQGAGPL